MRQKDVVHASQNVDSRVKQVQIKAFEQHIDSNNENLLRNMQEP